MPETLKLVFEKKSVKLFLHYKWIDMVDFLVYLNDLYVGRSNPKSQNCISF